MIAVFALIRSIGNGQSRTNYNITPLHDAAAHSTSETVTALLKAGADSEARTEHDATPLHLAASLGKAEAIIALLNAGANAKAITEEGKTAFDLAKDNSRLTVNLNGTEALQRLKNAAQ